MTTPLPKLALLGGYGLAFAVVALVQVAVTLVVATSFGLDVVGSVVWLVVVTLVDALLGVALGLFASAFATTEFQAIQLMPLVVLPQLLLCGLFQPRGEMSTVLRWAADVLPVSYAVEALQHVASSSTVDGGFVRDLLVLVAFVLGAIIAGAATLRRRTA
jgi:ABC-2 type transport system permease protein